jgi:hypothetical protein
MSRETRISKIPQSVFRFLKAKDVLPTEIYKQIVEVYGEGAVNEM